MQLVELTPAEIPALRVAMGDVQASVARFYADTAGSADLERAAVRSFVADAQVVNDLLSQPSNERFPTTRLCSIRRQPRRKRAWR